MGIMEKKMETTIIGYIGFRVQELSAWGLRFGEETGLGFEFQPWPLGSRRRRRKAFGSRVLVCLRVFS